ncbi:MAG: cell division protein FtsZ [Treponema sp.]|nr:cell division protein FtsZ [Treponema sp.]
MIELSVVNDESSTLKAPSPTVIKIIGCGGGGSSAVNRMIDAGVSDVEFIVLNTDVQALNVSRAQKRLAIGQELTGGLGAGGEPSVGESAAQEDSDMITNVVKGANMVIITAGMGGGTGTGSAPVVASLARQQGALTIAVVTTPFEFERSKRMKNAQEGLKKLRENVDSLIVIPNEQIMKIVDKKMNFRQAFRLADDVLCQGVQGISEIITKPGDINIDFADVRSVLKNQGEAILGVGIGEGENRAVDAAQRAISNPMLADRHIDGASNILVNITGPENLSMIEVNEIIENISASADKDCNLFWGQVFDPDMGDKVSVTVIATGFEKNGKGSSDSREQAAENSNIIDYGTFERMMTGKAAINLNSSDEDEEEEEQEEEVEMAVKHTSVGAGLFSNLEKDAEDSPAKSYDKEVSTTSSLSEKLRRAVEHDRSGIEPPANFSRRSDDLKQPAVWRNLNGLSKSIDLTDN